jgi:hypothetical protein
VHLDAPDRAMGRIVEARIGAATTTSLAGRALVKEDAAA